MKHLHFYVNVNEWHLKILMITEQICRVANFVFQVGWVLRRTNTVNVIHL